MSKKPNLVLIGEGESAEVYAWEKGDVLKLYREAYPRQQMEHEARVAQIVHNHGLPVPAFRGTVEVNGRYGIIYERVIGTSMMDALVNRPATAFRLMWTLAELQADLHQRTMIEGLPTQPQMLRDRILSVEPELLPPEVRDSVLEHLDRMPVGAQLCHGDFHPGNVILTDIGPVVIDWSFATNGNPLGDVAFSSLILSKATPPDGKPLPWILDLFRQWLHRRYLKRYFQLRPSGQEEFEQWLIIAAAVRLSEGMPGDRPITEAQELLALIRHGLF